MSASLSRFNAGIQLSEHGLNSVIKALANFQVIPTEMAGSYRTFYPPIGLSIEGDYHVQLPTPEIFLDTRSGDHLGIRGSMSGKCAVILKLDGSPIEWSFKFGVDASYELITQVSTERNGNEAYLALRFVELAGLTVTLSGQMPVHLKAMLQMLARRFIEVHLLRRVIKVPLTPWFETQELGGWSLELPTVRVIDGPLPQDLDSLTVAFNTWPNRGTGNAAGLADWVHHGDGKAMVGIAVDERFLLQTLQVGVGALSIPKRFNEQGRPDDKGGIELTRVVVNLRDGYIHVTVEAKVSAKDKTTELFAHAKATISYNEKKFEVKIYDVEVEAPWFVHLVGFILFRLYYLVILAVIQSVLGKSLGNIGEGFLEDFLNGGSVPLTFDTLLGTTPLRIASVVRAIEIAASELRVLADIHITSGSHSR